MNKALFGLITVVAFVAIGVLVYNRAVQNAGPNDKTNAGNSISTVTAKTGSCCDSPMAEGKASCCSETGSCCPASKAAAIMTSADGACPACKAAGTECTEKCDSCPAGGTCPYAGKSSEATTTEATTTTSKSDDSSN